MEKLFGQYSVTASVSHTDKHKYDGSVAFNAGLYLLA